GRDVQFLVALSLAIAGDSAAVQTLVNDFGKRFPEDTMVNFVDLPTLRALQALLRHDLSKAVAELQLAAPYESGQQNTGNTISMDFYPRSEEHTSELQS